MPEVKQPTLTDNLLVMAALAELQYQTTKPAAILYL
jgi:hypothetical protein